MNLKTCSRQVQCVSMIDWSRPEGEQYQNLQLPQSWEDVETLLTAQQVLKNITGTRSWCWASCITLQHLISVHFHIQYPNILTSTRSVHS